MKSIDKICFKCGLKVYDKENYFAFVEMDNGKKVHTDYCHKSCWDKVKDTLVFKRKAEGLLEQLSTFLPYKKKNEVYEIV